MSNKEESKIQRDVAEKKLKKEQDKYMREDVELQKLRELRYRMHNSQQRKPVDEE